MHDVQLNLLAYEKNENIILDQNYIILHISRFSIHWKELIKTTRTLEIFQLAKVYT
jgi:hypothetical protein